MLEVMPYWHAYIFVYFDRLYVIDAINPEMLLELFWSHFPFDRRHLILHPTNPFVI